MGTNGLWTATPLSLFGMYPSRRSQLDPDTVSGVSPRIDQERTSNPNRSAKKASSASMARTTLVALRNP